MIPVKTQEGYIITVEKLPENISMYDHFVTECGWSENELDDMDESNFFCAKVAAWHDGIEKGKSYLGCCYHESLREFITDSVYFDDMVNEAVEEAKVKR